MGIISTKAYTIVKVIKLQAGNVLSSVFGGYVEPNNRPNEISGALNGVRHK